MSNIIPLSEIQGIGKDTRIRTHITPRGSIYIPKSLGGVRVEAGVDEEPNCVYVRVIPNDTEWKRYIYIGTQTVSMLFAEGATKPLPIQLSYDEESEHWLWALCF